MADLKDLSTALDPPNIDQPPVSVMSTDTTEFQSVAETLCPDEIENLVTEKIANTNTNNVENSEINEITLVSTNQTQSSQESSFNMSNLSNFSTPNDTSESKSTEKQVILPNEQPNKNSTATAEKDQQILQQLKNEFKDFQEIHDDDCSSSDLTEKENNILDNNKQDEKESEVEVNQKIQDNEPNSRNVSDSFSTLNPEIADQAKKAVREAVKQRIKQKSGSKSKTSPRSQKTSSPLRPVSRANSTSSHASANSLIKSELNPLKSEAGSISHLSQISDLPSEISSMLSVSNYEMNELMKEQQRRKFCEQQIQRLQNKILGFQQKIRVFSANEQHTKSSINGVNDAVARLLKETKDRELAQNKKIEQMSGQLSKLVVERKKMINLITQKKQDIQNLENLVNTERSNRMQSETTSINKIKAIQNERDDLWRQKENLSRDLHKSKTDNENRKAEINLVNHKLNQLSQALEKERNEQAQKYKHNLQEKEEKIIALTFDVNKFRENEEKLKFDLTRFDNENKNLKLNLDNLNDTIRKLNEKLLTCNQTEREYKRLLASAEQALETTLSNEKIEYETRIKRLEENFSKEISDLKHKFTERCGAYEKNIENLNRNLIFEKEQREQANRQLKKVLKEKFSEAINHIESQAKSTLDLPGITPLQASPFWGWREFFEKICQVIRFYDQLLHPFPHPTPPDPDLPTTGTQL